MMKNQKQKLKSKKMKNTKNQKLEERAKELCDELAIIYRDIDNRNDYALILVRSNVADSKKQNVLVLGTVFEQATLIATDLETDGAMKLPITLARLLLSGEYNEITEMSKLKKADVEETK